MEHLKNIAWSLNTPLTKAKYYMDDMDAGPVPSKVWNTKLNIRKNDKIVILYDDTNVLMTDKIQGSTIKSLFSTLERNLNKIISNKDLDNVKIVYTSIGKWLRKNNRLELVKRFENNRLKIKDLLGDHDFYNGSLHRSDNGIWHYYLES